MKKIFSFIILSLLMLSGDVFSAQSKEQEYIYATVARISDGDTILVNIEGQPKPVRVRLVGIDTPELHLPAVSGHNIKLIHSKGFASQDPWGQLATDYLVQLIPPGTIIILESEGVDHYGRMLGRILRTDYSDINLEMVQVGWATPYIYCAGSQCDEGFMERHNVVQYLQACDMARQNQWGIFNPENPMEEMPFEFRLRIQKRNPNKYVGDIDSHRLVAPENYNEIDLCRRVFFDSESKANALGFYR